MSTEGYYFMNTLPINQKRVESFKLVVQHGEHKGKEYLLPKGEIILGRWDPESGSFPEINLDLVDVEARISRRHAKIQVEPGRVMLEDLNSLNGTYVNRGEKLAPGIRCSLQINDEIIIGKTIFRLKSAE